MRRRTEGGDRAGGFAAEDFGFGGWVKTAAEVAVAGKMSLRKDLGEELVECTGSECLTCLIGGCVNTVRAKKLYKSSREGP